MTWPFKSKTLNTDLRKAYAGLMDRLVETWHESATEGTIAEWIGCSREDYGRWVEDPRYIIHIEQGEQ